MVVLTSSHLPYLFPPSNPKDSNFTPLPPPHPPPLHLVAIVVVADCDLTSAVTMIVLRTSLPGPNYAGPNAFLVVQACHCINLQSDTLEFADANPILYLPSFPEHLESIRYFASAHTITPQFGLRSGPNLDVIIRKTVH